jgi:peptidoglycan/LPS O-acetylase OafA/YrhL
MITQTTTSTPLSTKNHFEVLDGLRGIAAIGVVVFHFSEWLFPDSSKNFIGHGFLAVDFFFCLSGFVISYAYDDRIHQMSLGQFFKLRLIRLHPLVVIGSLLGIIFWFWAPSSFDTSKYSVTQIILLSVTSLLLIPMPTMADRLLNLFGLNAPSWSLFWEYIANILYATILHKLSVKALKYFYFLLRYLLPTQLIKAH